MVLPCELWHSGQVLTSSICHVLEKNQLCPFILPLENKKVLVCSSKKPLLFFFDGFTKLISDKHLTAKPAETAKKVRVVWIFSG
jgi:hypothetical protein